MPSLDLKPGIVAFDTETTGLNPWGSFKRWGFYPARPFAFSFCDLEGNTLFKRWEVDPFTRRVIPDPVSFKVIKDILEDPKITKIGHNIGYDIRMCQKVGIKVQGKIHDTLIMMHVITGGKELQYALKPLCKKFLGIGEEDETDLHQSTLEGRRKGKKLGWSIANKDTNGRDPIKADYWMAKHSLLEKYAVTDAVRAMTLYRLAKEEIETSKDFYNVYTREMELFKVVKKMEDTGVQIFPKEIDKLEKFYLDYMVKQRAVGDQHGGKGMNYNSHLQKRKIFCDIKKIAPLKTTAKGNPQLDGEFLVYAASKDPLAKAILEYNAANHGIKSFLKPYQRFMTEEVEEGGVWVLHPNYRQCGPVTGRFSCSDPNLMQVASETSGRKRAEVELHPRRCFGPRKGHIWYLPDWSQIEVWIFSFQSEEKAMMEALLAGHDFHGAVGKQVWGGEKDYVTQASYYRKRAKLVLFCKLYGGGVRKTAFLLDCSEESAREFVGRFDDQLPGIKRYMRKMTDLALRHGEISNPFGRKYFIDPDFCYKAVNYMIQGTAADVMKNSMINISKMLAKKWGFFGLRLTLHDEFVIEVPMKYHSKRLMRDIVFEMQRDSKTVGVPVPLPVSMKIAPQRWSETIDVEL